MLLVSCCGETDAGLFLVNEETGKVKKVFDKRCTGITMNSDGTIFAYIHPLQSVCHFSRKFLILKSVNIGHNFHGLFLYNGSLFAMDTYNDLLHQYKAETLIKWFSWDFYKGHRDTHNTRDGYHLNDIFIYQDVMFLCMFRDFIPAPPPAFYSGRVYIKYLGDTSFNNLGEVFLSRLIQPHSPFIYDNDFYVCNSRDSSLVYGALYRDYSNKNRYVLLERKEVIIGEGFTRGLLVDSDKIYVGISNSKVRTVPEIFAKAQCGIKILDKRSFKPIKFIPIPANEVYGIARYE